MKILKVLIISIIIPFTHHGQVQLFEKDSTNKIIATVNPENTLGLKLNKQIESSIITNRDEHISLKLPFFNSEIVLELQQFKAYSDDIQTILKTEQEDEIVVMIPQLLSYRIMYQGKAIGIMNFVHNEINATFLIDNKQFEISKHRNAYVLFDVNNSINQNTFSCAVDQQVAIMPNLPSVSTPSSTPLCVELAIDIDNYTRNTFATDQETLDWALAIISGVSQLYEAQTNAAITVVNSTIWNVVDPYDTCTSTSSVLNQVGNYWQANNAGINRDLVHFMSKKPLGGGIAWLNVLCSYSSGYAVSASLNSDTNFIFPNPSYTWNLEVIAHELGHNFGSPHTHACNWTADPTTTPPFPGGGIDDCGVAAGYGNACTPPAPTPTSPGTIMSYCHLGGGPGIILQFHEIVINQALNPGFANASCLTTCTTYGCTNPAAFNYDPNATTDDGSCCLIAGCLDPLATNYDLNACYDDSSCCYQIDLGSDINACDTVLLTAPSGTSYLWNTGSNNQNINVAQSGTYSVTVQENNCSSTDSINVSISDINLALISVTDVGCTGQNNGSIDYSLSSSGTTNIIWTKVGDPSFYSTDQNIYNLYSGTYVIAVTDNIGCTIYDTVVVNQPALSVLSDSIVPVSCFGNNTGEIIINYTPNNSVTQSSFIWTGPNGFSATSQSINNLTAGTYYLELTENNLCITNRSYIITEPPVLLVSEITQDVSCFGGADATVFLNISGGVPNYLTDWYGINPLNLSAGSYVYTVTDQNNCAYSNTVTINQPNQPIATTFSTTDVSCFNGNNGTATLSITGGTSPYTTVWQNSYPTQLTAGYHSYTIIDTNGCVHQDSVIIYQPTQIMVTEQLTDALCYGDNSGTASLIITGGIPTYNVDWAGYNNNALSAGTYPYIVTDNNNCSYSGVVNIGQPNPITPTYSIVHPTCPNTTDGSVSVSIVGGSAPYTQNWNGVNPQMIAAGTYNYSINDNNGCTDTFQFDILPISNIAVTEHVFHLSCAKFCDGSVNLIITNGVLPYSVDWFGYSVDSLCSGIYDYQIIDSLGCVFDDSVLVTAPQPISLNISQQGTLLTANTNGGTVPYSFDWWSDNGQTGTSQTINTTGTGNYYCIAYDINNCHSDTVMYHLQQTGVNNELGSLSIYPNPTEGKIFIEFTHESIGIDAISIADILGKRLLIEHKLNKELITEINVSHLAKGVYFLSVALDKVIITKKIVIN